MKKLITILIAISIGIILMFSNKTRLKASTVTNWSSVESRIWYDQQGTNTSGSWASGSNHTFSPSYPVTSIQWRVKASNGLSNENTYTFTIGYTPSPDSLSVNNVYIRREGDYPNETITCKEWQRNTSTGRYTKECTFTPGYNYSSSQYLFIRIIFNESYVTSLQSYISGYNERESTNAVITDSTNQILQGQEDMTNAIIQGSLQGVKDQIESQMVCKEISKKDIKIDGYLQTNGIIENSSAWARNTFGITEYLKTKNATFKAIKIYNNSASAYCFYTEDKTLINCKGNNTLAVNQEITIPTNASFVRFSINKLDEIPVINYCQNGNQAIQDILDQDTEYNTNGEEIEGKQDMDDYKQAEENVLNSLDFSAVDNLDITINANASNFIWQIVDRLRQINSKIILLFTSVLGLGLVKLILNR